MRWRWVLVTGLASVWALGSCKRVASPRLGAQPQPDRAGNGGATTSVAEPSSPTAAAEPATPQTGTSDVNTPDPGRVGPRREVPPGAIVGVVERPPPNRVEWTMYPFEIEGHLPERVELEVLQSQLRGWGHPGAEAVLVDQQLVRNGADLAENLAARYGCTISQPDTRMLVPGLRMHRWTARHRTGGTGTMLLLHPESNPPASPDEQIFVAVVLALGNPGTPLSTEAWVEPFLGGLEIERLD